MRRSGSPPSGWPGRSRTAAERPARSSRWRAWPPGVDRPAIPCRSMSVSLKTDGTVAIITLDDAPTRNALTGESAGEFLDAVATVQNDPGVAALVLRGANGAFCSG